MRGDVAMTRNAKGQFVKGARAHPATEFKKGQHWRPRRPYWKRDWLYEQYVTLGRSASEIAGDFGVTDGTMYHWLHKHKIPVRSISEAREIKYWGLAGECNGMYGVCGPDHPNWQGGITPERQAFYASLEWATACSAVWQRDEATCQRCGCGADKNVLHVHHIVSFAVEELRAEVSNLVLLCTACHQFVHSRKNTRHEFIKKGGGTKCRG